MIIGFLAMLLLAQGAPARPPKVEAKGSISGVVLHNVTGAPLANVRVMIAKTDTSPDVARLICEMIGQDPTGAPPSEMSVPVEFLQMMKQEMGTQQAEMAALAANGKIPAEDLPPEMALLTAIDLDEIEALLVDPS